MTLKRVGTRYRFLNIEISDMDPELARIITEHAPALPEISGVGTVVASQLLVTIGYNPERLTSEAQFAALTGTAPIPASSDKTTRHRLSLGRDRAANASIHRLVLVRMSKDPRTRDYVAKRTAEGKSKLEVMRCLKRYVAREISRVLKNPRPVPPTNDLRPKPQTRHIILTTAAQQFNVWPSSISRIELGKSRDQELTNDYRNWLDQQPQK